MTPHHHGPDVDAGSVRKGHWLSHGGRRPFPNRGEDQRGACSQESQRRPLLIRHSHHANPIGDPFFPRAQVDIPNRGTDEFRVMDPRRWAALVEAGSIPPAPR